MTQYVTKHTTKQVLSIPEDRLNAFAQWLFIEIEDAFLAKKRLEALWREVQKMYNGIPKLPKRDIPIPNAPNIEVTIGAIAADTIYAQAIDLVFNVSPIVTVRPKPKFKDDVQTVAVAKALQILVNHIAGSEEANMRLAADTSVLDDVQMGSGFVYTPYVRKIKKTKTAKILSVGPRFYPIPPEDIITSGLPSQGIQELPLFGMRFYYTENDLAMEAKENNWNIEGAQPIGSKDWVRTTRETLGKQFDTLNRKGTLYDGIHCYCYYDIDGDGIAEDLFAVWNHSGRKLMYVNYNPMDRRPVEVMVYQRRAHLLYGMGVLEMMMPFEEKLSDVHNYATLNILLANSRVWIGSGNLPETMQVWPGKYIPAEDPDKDLKGLEMADVYNSIWQDQMVTMQLANQRVGINQTSQANEIPSRTPGITAMTFLQQVNKRFTPAFNDIKFCLAGALRQALYRYQERLLAGDQEAEAAILQVLGYTDGSMVIDLLRKPSFDEQVDVELTAASASINREADRQNSIMLTNILAQYYQRTIELLILAANPQTPPEVASVARKVAAAAGEMIDRTIRTFDQVRDPSTFIIEMTDELNAVEANAQDQQALGQLMTMLGRMFGGGQAPKQLNAPPTGEGGE